MYYRNITRLLQEEEIYPTARALRVRAGVAVSDKASKVFGYDWRGLSSWYFYFELNGTAPLGAGFRRGPRKRDAASSANSASTASRHYRTMRRLRATREG